MPSAGSNPKPASAASAAEDALSAIEESTVSDTIESLRRQNEELRRTSQYRSLFLSRLAHELRTPLTSILGFSEILLSQEKLTDAQRAFCERIQSSAQQLQANLNQLSDLARLEGPQARLSLEKISIAEAFRNVLPALTRSMEKKRIKLSCYAPDDLPTIVSDRGRVRLVIYNVLAYAISRSPEAGTVGAVAESAEGSVRIAIRDSGDPLADPSRIGVLDADDNSSSGELGLSIACLNIEMLGGSIRARNLQGEVELTIELPTGPPAP